VKRFFVIVVLGILLLVGLTRLVPSFGTAVFGPARPIGIQDGDIVFQNSRSSQSDAIRRATHSPWTHMGIVIYRSGNPYVLEAAATVRMTPFRSWTKRGVGGHYVVKRLKKGGPRIGAPEMTRAHGLVGRYLRKDYDLAFEWSDDRMYCSELVWKIYMRAAGIRIGDLQPMSSLDLGDPVVQAKLRERYGDRIPLDEPVITPVAMFDSPLLEVVQRR
jgi:hypothetical protein